jgi:hypothetical protein
MNTTIVDGEVLQLLELRFIGNTLEQRLRIRRGIDLDAQMVDEWGAVPRFDFTRKGTVDWSKVDWDKKSGLLAVELGVSIGVVCQRRKTMGHKAKSVRENTDWSGVDWTLSNGEIAMRLQVHQTDVRMERLARHIPKCESHAKTVTQAMVESADWVQKRDVDLAKEWGVSREYARQLRQMNNKPKSRYHCIKPDAIRAYTWLDAHQSEISGMVAGEVARMIPIRASVASKMRHLRHWCMKNPAGDPFVYPKNHCKVHDDWVDWRLPNVLLSMIWDMSGSWAAIQRCQRQHGKHTWSPRSNDLAFRDAVAAEMDKAKLHKRNVDADAVWARIESCRGARGHKSLFGELCGRINFDLPNSALAAIYGQTSTTVSNHRQREHKETKWQWQGRSRAWDTEEFAVAVRAEIVNARAVGVDVDEARVDAVVSARRAQRRFDTITNAVAA